MELRSRCLRVTRVRIFVNREPLSLWVAEISFPPQDRTAAKASLVLTVGWSAPQKAKVSRAGRASEIATHCFGLGVSRRALGLRQLPKRRHPHEFPRHPAQVISRSRERCQMAKSRSDLSESRLPPMVRLSLALGRRLEILQMRPADLALQGPPYYRRPSDRCAEYLESFTYNLHQGLAASAAMRNTYDCPRRPPPTASGVSSSFDLFLAVQMRHLGRATASGFPVGDRQGLAGFFAQTLDASQADADPAQLLQQSPTCRRLWRKRPVRMATEARKPGSKGASADLSRQWLHRDPAMGTNREPRRCSATTG